MRVFTMLSSGGCREERGAGKKSPRPIPAGFFGISPVWLRLVRRGAKSRIPPEGGFFGFQRAARISHAAIIEAGRADVNESANPIHAAETSESYTGVKRFIKNSPR